ncbi:hypothetical protein FKP32DRAFT_1753995, partial [Trametes sanguinea]
MNDEYTARCLKAQQQRVKEYAAKLKPIPVSKTESIINILMAARAAGDPIIPTLVYGFALTSAETGVIVDGPMRAEAHACVQSLSVKKDATPARQALAIAYPLNQILKQSGSGLRIMRNVAISETPGTIIFAFRYIGGRNCRQPNLDVYKEAIELFKEKTGTDQQPCWHFGREHHP